ncbi:MAG TPA: nucleotidyltransferase family protein, partial [Solirubrobacteraceae bacterium]
MTISAGCAERRETMGARARALAGQVDYVALERTLRTRKLLATLGPRIVELTDEGSPESFHAAVRRSLETGRRQASLLALLAGRAVEMLGAQEIPVAVLKGPTLAQAIYGDHGRRLSGDVDLLVAPEHLTRAVQVTRTLGYR